MSDDITAVSVPWPGNEEGIVDNARILHPWTAGTATPKTVKGKAYVSNRRIVGLEMEGATLHAYGVSEDGVTTRTLADGTSARFVSSAWVTTNRDAASTLLGEAIETLKALDVPWTDIHLAVDDRPLLGEDSDDLAQATVDADTWRCAVTGSMTLPGWSDLLLRPSIVDCKRDGAVTMLEFREDGAGADALPEVLIALADAAPGDAASYTLTVADLQVLPVLDKLADGAWERPAHLWIGAREGWLYLPCPEPNATLPYAIGSETRSCDIARCIGPGLAGMRGKLLLDGSGAKTLTVRIEDDRIGLALRIGAPAIVFQLAHMAVDGATLPFPTCAPSAGEQSRLDTVHLVPSTLSGSADGTWKFSMTDGQAATLAGAWTPSWSPGLPLFHTRSEDWVLPPDAAANGGKAVSPLRTLIPLLASTGTVTCTFGPGDIATVTGFDTISDTATAHGPLARFSYWTDGGNVDDLLCTERWPAPDTGAVILRKAGEPAVLRPLYRLLPAELADTLGAAPFGATLAGVPLAEPPRPVQNAPGGTGYAWRAGTRNPLTPPAPATLARRTETPAVWPDHHFGWDTGSTFRSHSHVLAEAASAQPAAWDWLEHRPLTAGGTDFASLLWVRLSDGSLISEKFADTGSIQEALDQLGTGNPPALAPVDLLHAGFEDAGGLPLLALYETVGAEKSEFSLVLRSAPMALVDTGATVVASASRIVAAWAGKVEAIHELDRGIVTSHLTRVFLELERESGAARVVRALVGWEVRKAFGLDARAMHVTEIFDTEAQETTRKLEFNGVLQVAGALGAHCTLSIYCWDAVLRRDSETLPVICNYELANPGNPVETAAICALQDARVFDDHLDLTADIAYFGTNSQGVQGTAAHPWEPERRGLFRFTVSLQPGIYNLRGFVKVRMRAGQAPAKFVRNVTVMRLIPAWALCDREIVPRFTSGRSAERGNAAWCSQGLLRSRQEAAGGTGLDVQVFYDVDLWSSPFSYGCTLVGEALSGATVTDGLPVWVPSPLREPTGVAPTPASRPQYRLWIFNPHAYAVDSWPAEPIAATATADEEKQAVAGQAALAVRQARAILWRAGWTREAVLERQPSASETRVLPSWTVIDSPLQNRGASIAWMGWPMAVGDGHPVDELPLSAQVVQRDPFEPDSFSVQVAFEDDHVGPGGAPLWPVLYRPNDGPAPAAQQQALGMLGFASRGLRVGVQHRLVHYGASIRTASTAPPRLRRAAGGRLTTIESDEQGHSVHWAQEPVSAGDVTVRHDAGLLTLTLPPAIASVRIAGLPPSTVLADGTTVLTDTTVVHVVPAGAAAPAPGGTVTLSVPEGPLPHFTVEHQVSGAWLALSVFPGFKPRLAGVFDAGHRLLGFGEESVAYLPAADGQWMRSNSARLRLSPGAAIGAVMTIDIDGTVTTHEAAP